MGCGLPIYTFNRHCEEINKSFNDGSHIIYVNGNYHGDDDIGKLMHDFRCKNAEDINYPELANSVRHFKEEGDGAVMCEAVEEYAKEYAKEEAIKVSIEFGIEFGIAKEKIISKLCSKYELSEQEANEIYEKYAEGII